MSQMSLSLTGGFDIVKSSVFIRIPKEFKKVVGDSTFSERFGNQVMIDAMRQKRRQFYSVHRSQVYHQNSL